MSEKKQHEAVRIREVVSKGSVAVVEEGLFAGSNFLIGVLLARWLLPVDYGAFTTAYSLFLLLGGAVYSAICIQPILVFGSREHASQFGRYFGCVLVIHAILAGGLSACMAAIAVWLWYGDSLVLARTFLALTAVTPFITLLWLARRAHYALLQPHWPLLGGTLYLILLVVGCYVLFRTSWLSPSSALLVIGAASLASSVPLIALIRPAPWLRGTNLTPRVTLARHWQYGRWPMLTSTLRWSTSYAYYLLLPLYVGLEASATLRAHMNLVLPILHANSALYGILIPQFTRTFMQHGASKLLRFTRAMLLLYGFGALIFWAGLMVFGESIFALLYRGQYHADIVLLAMLGLLPLSGGITGVLESALFAAGRPKAAATSYAVSAIITVTVGWVLLARHGTLGAGMGWLTASIAATITMAFSFIRSFKAQDVAARTLPRGDEL